MTEPHTTSNGANVTLGVEIYSGTYADVPNQDADETTFVVRSLPPGHWSGVGAHFRILLVVHCPTGGPGRHVRVYCYDTPVYESGAFNAVENGALMIVVDAWRAPNSRLRIFCRMAGDSVTDYQVANYEEVVADFTAPIPISIRGQAHVTGDLVYVVGHSEISHPPKIVTLG